MQGGNYESVLLHLIESVNALAAVYPLFIFRGRTVEALGRQRWAATNCFMNECGGAVKRSH